MPSRAVSPTHITGFFEIKDQEDDVLRRGSRGAGVCLALPVLTEVEPSSNSGEVSIFINNARAHDAQVSQLMARRLLDLSGTTFGLIVRHYTKAPTGSGFGTSGAAALSLALAGSQALDLEISDVEAAQLAHAVEVILQTGLGTVAGEFYGGLELRSRAGAPGFGEVTRITTSDDYSVVALHNGPMRTSALLSDPAIRHRINAVGGRLTEDLLKDMRVERFLQLSREFTTSVGVASDELRRVMLHAEKWGYSLGMAMFGRTLFTIVRSNEVDELVRLMQQDVPDGRVVIARIEYHGAHRL